MSAVAESVWWWERMTDEELRLTRERALTMIEETIGTMEPHELETCRTFLRLIEDETMRRAGVTD